MKHYLIQYERLTGDEEHAESFTQECPDDKPYTMEDFFFSIYTPAIECMEEDEAKETIEQLHKEVKEEGGFYTTFSEQFIKSIQIHEITEDEYNVFRKFFI